MQTILARPVSIPDLLNNPTVADMAALFRGEESGERAMSAGGERAQLRRALRETKGENN
jgi:hypothetical protein